MTRKHPIGIQTFSRIIRGGGYVYGDVTQGEIESSLGIENLGGQLKMLDEKYGIISNIINHKTM